MIAIAPRGQRQNIFVTILTNKSVVAVAKEVFPHTLFYNRVQLVLFLQTYTKRVKAFTAKAITFDSCFILQSPTRAAEKSGLRQAWLAIVQVPGWRLGHR